MPDYPVYRSPQFEQKIKKYKKTFHLERLNEIVIGLESILSKHPTRGKLHADNGIYQIYSVEPYNMKAKMDYRIVWMFNGEKVLLWDIFPLPDETGE